MAETHYHERMKSLAAHAHPVIQRVYEDDTNQFVNIAVPFTDGRRNLQVMANIEEAVDSSGTTLVDELEKTVVLGVLDQLWKEHLRNMDDLRSNVQHARFEQKDPLLIYKFESYELFKTMVQRMNTDVASFLLKCQLPSQPDQVKRAPGAGRSSPRVCRPANRGCRTSMSSASHLPVLKAVAQRRGCQHLLLPRRSRCA